MHRLYSEITDKNACILIEFFKKFQKSVWFLSNYSKIYGECMHFLSVLKKNGNSHDFYRIFQKIQ